MKSAKCCRQSGNAEGAKGEDENREYTRDKSEYENKEASIQKTATPNDREKQK